MRTAASAEAREMPCHRAECCRGHVATEILSRGREEREGGKRIHAGPPIDDDDDDGDDDDGDDDRDDDGGDDDEGDDDDNDDDDEDND